MNLLSWLDVERVLASRTQNFTKLPEGISGIRTYSDAIEIDSTDENNIAACRLLKDAFGSQWQEADKPQIYLSYDNGSAIDVIFSQADESEEYSVKPLWKDLGYATDIPVLPSAPKPFTGKSRVAAFHFFKGGVGRTTSLLTWLMAVITQSRKSGSDQSPRILLVDADLEAQGSRTTIIILINIKKSVSSG
ncbi:MAG: hypothetical protein ACR2PT_19415 [Endozoicomonas sp.]